GHGGRRTIASVAKVAATSPISSPIRAIRVRSSARTHVASTFLITNTPTGFALSRRSGSSAPGLVRPRTLATGSTVAPSGVCYGRAYAGTADVVGPIEHNA